MSDQREIREQEAREQETREGDPGRVTDGPDPGGEPAAPGAPTAPAEAHREPPPETLECVQCRKEIPADAAMMAESQEYIVYFCSPGCHRAWEEAQAPGSDQQQEPREG